MSRRFRALVAHPHVEALGEMAEMLGDLGLSVETARSTVEGLNKLRSYPAHVIVAYHIMSSLGASVLALGFILPAFYLTSSLFNGPKASAMLRP